MRGHDQPRVIQLPDFREPSGSLPLLEVSAAPVLLSLPTRHRQPSSLHKFLQEAGQDQPPRRQKPPPVRVRSHRMHRPAVRAAPALHPQRPWLPVEVPLYVAMPPQPQPKTARAAWRPVPGVVLPGTTEKLDIDRYREYQTVATCSGTLGDRDGQSASVAVLFIGPQYAKSFSFCLDESAPNLLLPDQPV